MFRQCLHCCKRHEPNQACDPDDVAKARTPVDAGRQGEVDLLEDEEIRRFLLLYRWRHRPAL